MTKIKSKKAKQHLFESLKTIENSGAFMLSSILVAESIIIAEQEAEERHTKEMQELKDKITNLSICDIDAPTFTHTREFRSHFDYIRKCFIQKLIEKQLEKEKQEEE